jgi:nucleoside phosphorylase
MYDVAVAVAPNITLANEVGDAILTYQPIVVPGGNGVAGSTFLDNASYRNYVFSTFQAVCVDMETAAAAHVATQFGKKFIFFRSLSDLAGGGDEDNALGVFFGVAAANAVKTLSAFLDKLPIDNQSGDSVLVPNDHSPGEDTPGLLGILSFYEPELTALKNFMNKGKEPPEELIYGGRKFYRGTIAGADVVATLTGVSTTNAAMTTALMAMLYPGIERIVGGGIAGGVDPDLRVGDVVIPERWVKYQHQLYSKKAGSVFEPVSFEREILVGKECGGWDGVDTFLLGDGPCNYTSGETSNFGFFFPKTVQTPDPNAAMESDTISEGPTRKVRQRIC